MNRRELAVCISIFCAGSPLCVPAQTPGKRSIANQVSGYVPTYTIQLDEDHRTEYLMPSPIYEGPLPCTDDGTVFMDLFMPPRFDSEVLFAFEPDGKKTAYGLEDVPDLYDLAHKMHYSIDLTDADVSFLIRATPDSAKTFPAAGKAPRYTGERYWYIVRLDRNGSYESSFAIDLPHFEPERIAQFDTGQYLVLGVDKLEASPKLALLDSDGTLRRFLNPSKSLAIKSDTQESQEGRSAAKKWPHFVQVQQGLQSYQLAHHGSAVVLLEPGTTGPMFEVFPDGSVNVIPIQPQPGYELDSIIPSSGKNLFVRFRIPSDSFLGQGQGMIEEINVTDGTPLKRISFPGFSLWDILCIHDGTAEILRTRKPSNASSTATRIFDIYRADLIPAPVNPGH